MTDRLSFWIVAALAAAVALPIALGLGSLDLLTVAALPIAIIVAATAATVLCTLLLARALLRKPPSNLHWRGRRVAVLSGPRAWLVPALGLSALCLMRWSGALTTSLYRTSSDLHTRENWSTATETTHDVPMQTDERPDALDLGDAPGDVQQAFRSQFADLAVAGKSLSGRVRLELDPPFAAWPLWKSASREYRVTAHLVVWQSTSPPAVAGIVDGGVGGEASLCMTGFATERDFHAVLGKEIGTHARKAIDDQLAKLAEQKR